MSAWPLQPLHAWPWVPTQTRLLLLGALPGHPGTNIIIIICNTVYIVGRDTQPCGALITVS